MKRFRYTLVSVLVTLSLSSVMSFLFFGTLRGDYVVTGIVCGVVVELIVGRMAVSHRRALAQAHALVDRRVRERTTELERTNHLLKRELEERRDVRDQLIEAERLAVAGGVAAGVCHEIKNPLAAVFGNVELAQELIEGREDMAEVFLLLSEALQAARQVAAVTGDLQTLARPGTEPTIPIKVAEGVESALRLASPYLREQCDVVVEVPPELAVAASPSRLVQVLLNLLINAAKAARPESRNQVTIRSHVAADGMVAIEVQDTGIGMTEVVQQKLFDPFFTTRRVNGGTGLGLYLCRTIVSGYGGSMSFRSTPDEGSTFRFTLPAARG